MKMCFLIERRYAPYLKWFGTAFDNLKSSKKLKPLLIGILQSNDWKTREAYLVKAYSHLAKMHNRLKITPPLKTRAACFHDRPFQVINGERFASEIKKQITDPEIKTIESNAGGIDQFTDSTNILDSDTRKLKSLLYK